MPVCCRVLNHQMLRHPHVVRLHEVFLTADHINIVLELANHGSLFDLLHKRSRRGGGLPEGEARYAIHWLQAKGRCLV